MSFGLISKAELQNGRSKSQNQKQKSLKSKISLTKSVLNNNLIKKFLTPYGVGAVVSLAFIMVSLLTPAKAQAANPVIANVEIAKKVIENVTPVMFGEDLAQSINEENSTVENYVSKPLIAETQITEPVAPPVSVKTRIASARTTQLARSSYARYVPTQTASSYTTGANRAFPYGYCTYYVSQKRDITWSGNAGTWLSGAQAAGAATGSAPQPGAIMVTSESRAGHVAYVESVNGDQVTISEMNYNGYGVISTRTISNDSGVIKGYIY